MVNQLLGNHGYGNLLVWLDLTLGASFNFKVSHIADFKSAYISLIIGPRGFQCETNP